MLCISCLSSVVGVNTKLLIEYSMNKFSLQMCSLFNILSFNVLPLFHLYTYLAKGSPFQFVPTSMWALPK